MSFKSFIAGFSRGIATVEESFGMTVEHLTGLGLSAQFARDLHALGQAYFGPTTFTGKQRTARAALAQGRHDLAALIAIETFVAREKKAVAAWDLRIKLCRTPQDRVAGVGRAHFKSQRRHGPAAGVRITRRKHGNHTLSITAPALFIADTLGVLESVNASDLLQAFRLVVLEGNAGAVPAVRTNVVVRLDKWVRILRGQGADTVLQLTNGATMTGKEYLERTLADTGFVTLVHPVTGAVNLYRMERFANTKQRMMLSAQFPTCVWPQCTAPTDECQFHHVTAWKNGGLTNLNNLVPLCKYHNSVNEDSGPANRRGRIDVIDGRVAWLPPRGGPPHFL